MCGFAHHSVSLKEIITMRLYEDSLHLLCLMIFILFRIRVNLMKYENLTKLNYRKLFSILKSIRHIINK